MPQISQPNSSNKPPVDLRNVKALRQLVEMVREMRDARKVIEQCGEQAKQIASTQRSLREAFSINLKRARVKLSLINGGKE